MIKLSRLMVCLLLVLVATALTGRAAAAANASYDGVSLSPAIEQLTLNGSGGSKSYRVRLDNNLPIPVRVNFSSLDFKSLNDTGGLAFIGSSSSQVSHKYGLAKWLDLPTGPISLPAGSGRFVTIKVNNRTDLSPGGHYAAVLFQVINPPLAGSANRVELNQVLSSLLFVRKSGGEIYKLNIAQADLQRRFLGWPDSLNLLIANTGNTQTAPRGIVSLNGNQVPLNIDSALVLPGSSRLISADLTSARRPFWPGFYHVSVKYRPDSVDSFSTYSLRFFYISPLFALIVLLIIVALIGGIRRLRRRFIIGALLTAKLGAGALRLAVRIIWRAIILTGKTLPKIINLALRPFGSAGLKRVLVSLGLKADRKLRWLEVKSTKLARKAKRRSR